MKYSLYLAALLSGLAVCSAWAEQFFEIGDFEAHYMILDTLSLQPDVAESYGIERARNLSILTLSVLDDAGGAVEADISGAMTNLLGVQREIRFKAIKEGNARYAIATLQHSEETMRFKLTITTQDGQVHELKFQQKLYLGTK